MNKPKSKSKVPRNIIDKVNSPNEDIHIESTREKLSQDIDRTLSSLKRKR